MKTLKWYRLLLPLCVGTLAVLALLGALSPGKAVADVHREWIENWYWKDGGWVDYAPSGVPDFDQKQAGWDNPPGSEDWTYCGPVAAANSLWWFDSKFEPSPLAPPARNDQYYLLTAYGDWDDHSPPNVAPFVSDLACYLDTDGLRTGIPRRGTEVHDMAYGLQWYLYNDPRHPCYKPGRSRGGSTYDEYHVQLVKMPPWEWVVTEVERSEDVILLLGFWQDWAPGTGEWKRLGGHYVTVSGINSAERHIAFSDPYRDGAEAGRPGRVLSGTLLSHYPPHPGVPDPTIHNDAGNVSHDYYPITTTVSSPHGRWEVLEYLDPLAPPPGLLRQNCPDEFQGDEGDWSPVGGPIFVEVEYAIAVSPFYWKPGGEWVDTWWNEQWITEWWWYEDDGDSCLPDFGWALDRAWADGPVAVANSMWWFDSKAETLKTGGWPTPPVTPTDHYDLVIPHGEWDDHAISNTVPFIEVLTDALGTGPQGTTAVSMTTGIGSYLAAQGVADDFYTRTQDSPSFAWVADEVETCEDVILLLGFYEHLGGENWERKGGHWVNAAGVSRSNGLIGLSDPGINNAISPTLGPGRVFPPEHITYPFGIGEQAAPQNISHDIYRVISSTEHSGRLALVDYPATAVITKFVGLNGEEYAEWTHNPISTVVEWAIGVSPYSDLVLTKTEVVTEVVPGDNVTYTLEYENAGLAAAEHVTITDMLRLDHVTDVGYTSWPPLSASSATTYAWTLDRLSYGQSGTITITAQSLVTRTLYNTASITGLNSIGGPTPDRDPTNNTGGTSPTYLYLPLILKS